MNNTDNINPATGLGWSNKSGYARFSVEGIRDRGLKARYGISLKDWNILFGGQGRVCVICLTNEPDGRGWHTDHDPKSGRIRGILCSKCNIGLGHFKDNTKSLERAINYLETK